MLIAVVNQSTVVPPDVAQRMVGACARQVRLHAAPHLGRVPVPVILYETLQAVPAGAHIVALLDNADVAGALGYHDKTPDGLPYSRVFAKTVLDNRGTHLKGPLSVSVTLSHEILEMFWDPDVNLWADDGRTSQIAVEACDPVEGDVYEISGISVSNFVLPAYFDIADKVGPWDYLGLLKGPWTMTKGGYLLVRRAGQVSQRFGASYPEWRKSTKSVPAARTARRMRAT